MRYEDMIYDLQPEMQEMQLDLQKQMHASHFCWCQ